MKANVTIYESLDELKKHRFRTFSREDSLGYLYACEFRQFVKIGITKNPVSRLSTHSQNLRIYGENLIGRIAITRSFSYSSELESYLHNMFSAFKKDSEVFDVPLERVANAITQTISEPFFNYIYSL